MQQIVARTVREFRIEMMVKIVGGVAGIQIEQNNWRIRRAEIWLGN